MIESVCTGIEKHAVQLASIEIQIPIIGYDPRVLEADIGIENLKKRFTVVHIRPLEKNYRRGEPFPYLK